MECSCSKKHCYTTHALATLAVLAFIILAAIILHGGWITSEPRNLIYHYQTLITGLLAVIFASLAIRATRDQTTKSIAAVERQIQESADARRQNKEDNGRIFFAAIESFMLQLQANCEYIQKQFKSDNLQEEIILHKDVYPFFSDEKIREFIDNWIYYSHIESSLLKPFIQIRLNVILIIMAMKSIFISTTEDEKRARLLLSEWLNINNNIQKQVTMINKTKNSLQSSHPYLYNSK